MTWSALGPHVPDAVLTRILAEAFGDREWPAAWERSYWRRFPHRDTGREGSGPEPDVFLGAEPGHAYSFECKWSAELGKNQGTDGTTSQLAMGHKVARARCDDPAMRGVLVIVPGPARYPKVGAGEFARFFAPDGDGYRPLGPALDIEARAVTWEAVAAVLAAIPGCEEAARYLRWRLDLLPSTS